MTDERESLCKGLGFSGVGEVHQFIVDAIRGGIERLPGRGLTASKLEQLGYTAAGLRRLGCREEQLALIGFAETESPPPPSAESPGDPNTVKELLAEKMPYGTLKQMGVSTQHCRTAGADVTHLLQLAFPMVELCRVFPISELRRAGQGVLDLTPYFTDQELKAGGISAAEMRMAGRTIQQLQRIGYNDNHIRTAGYSINDLSMAGLAKQTRDFIKGR